VLDRLLRERGALKCAGTINQLHHISRTGEYITSQEFLCSDGLIGETVEASRGRGPTVEWLRHEWRFIGWKCQRHFCLPQLGNALELPLGKDPRGLLKGRRVKAG